MKIEYTHLLGRTFTLGSHDCYGLVRDFYKDNYNIELPNYARPDDFWSKNLDIFTPRFYQLGFRVHDVAPNHRQPGDIPMMALWSRYASHCGVFLPNGKFLHHVINNISREDDYTGDWKNMTLYILRHKDVVYNPEEESIDYLDRLAPSVKETLDEHTP